LANTNLSHSLLDRIHHGREETKRLHSNAHDDFQFPLRGARGAMSDHKYEIICHLIARAMREKFFLVFFTGNFSSLSSTHDKGAQRRQISPSTGMNDA
jgi:hypothetical protein